MNTPDAPTHNTDPTGFSHLNRQKLGALLVLISQAGIVVTGSIVRVTGSGLGCVTWPNCQPGSLVPVKGAAPALHQAIEWGNRLLTFVVAAAALYCFIQVMRAHRRKPILVLSFIQGLGVIIQAIIGGISVHLQLQWWIVALHFLPSMILVWLAALLYLKIQEPDNGHAHRYYPPAISWLSLGAAVALAVVIVTGTMVTGAGQHSGDHGIGMLGRLSIELETIAHIHAHFMYLYLGLTIGLVVALALVPNVQAARRQGVWLIAFIVIQAGIGIIQFNWGVPRWTVPFHVGLSGVIVALMGFVYGRAERLVPADEAEAA